MSTIDTAERATGIPAVFSAINTAVYATEYKSLDSADKPAKLPTNNDTYSATLVSTFDAAIICSYFSTIIATLYATFYSAIDTTDMSTFHAA